MLAAAGGYAETLTRDNGLHAGACEYNAGVKFETENRRLSEFGITYPDAQVDLLGEGWALVTYTVTPTGTAANIRVIDSLGDKSFVDHTIDGVSRGRYEPAVVGGHAVERHDVHFDMAFRLDMNRGRGHREFDEAFDVGHRLRKDGKNEEAVRAVRPYLKQPLTLYEHVTLAHGLALAYTAMKDYRRALVQIRHSTIAGEKLLTYGSRAYALALLAELEARNGNANNAVCAFETLKLKYKDFEPSPELLALIGAANAVRAGTDPIRTEVEIVEADQEGSASVWEHDLMRHGFRFGNVQGAAKYRLVCPLALLEGDVREGAEQQLDPAKGNCYLEGSGAVGSKFILDEH